MNELYREWVVRRGVGWVLGVGGKPKVGNTFHKETNTATVKAETVISSSLTPQAALLVPISGPIDPVVDHCGFTGLAKDCLLKQTWPSIAL